MMWIVGTKANLCVVYGAWYADSGTADGREAGFVEWPER
jgi:hypothetical protein